MSELFLTFFNISVNAVWTVAAVLRYREPARWVTVVAVVLCAVLAVCCLTVHAGGDITGTYVYEGEGFGGDFTVTIREDGTFTYYEGPLSSIFGDGTWYLAEDSADFIFVDVADGDRFLKVNS